MKKHMVRYVGKPLCLLLAVCFLTVDVGIRTAQAGMISTETVLATQADEDARTQVSAFFAREDVQQVMTRQGVAADEVASRVASLSDAEVMRIANELDQLPAGASLGTVVGAVLFIFVVLLVTDILGYTKVFTFVQPIR
ncbi:MAG: PA2779 family protein [Pelovirga sp.]